jgi:2-polyprenyl-6-methoxyphenol hydroxylase-like FAD-dependent oxidoreductase
MESQNASSNNLVYDVIVAGAGPVGLFLACELALAHCSVLILEKSEDQRSSLKQLPFGLRGLSAPAIEALHRRGLLERLDIHKRMKNPHANTVVQGSRRQAGHFAGIPFYLEDVDTSRWENRVASSTDTNLISEIQEIEDVLSRRAGELGVKVHRGMAVTGCHQTTDGVFVAAGSQYFMSKWLVGCDGARSAVRKAGGFEFAGTEPEFTGYSTLVELADPEKLRPGRNVTERGMYMQSQPGYVLLQDFDRGAFHKSKQPVTREHVQAVLRRISDTNVTITNLRVATTWTDRARQVTAYRDGRVLLAGDAAHIHSPLGGQGLNLGLGDAMNLGWKLAATIRQVSPAGLLDTYHDERYPIGAQILDWSRAQVAIMKPDPQGRALHAIFRDLINTREGATYVASRVWGINTRYDLGNDHPLVGCSISNFAIADGAVGDLMHDGNGLLLDFNNDDSLLNWTRHYGKQIRYVSVKDESKLSAILVRPDGIVAWAIDRGMDAQGVQAAADMWFIRCRL